MRHGVAPVPCSYWPRTSAICGAPARGLLPRHTYLTCGCAQPAQCLASATIAVRTSTLHQIVVGVVHVGRVLERHCVTTGDEDTAPVTDAPSALVENYVAVAERGRPVLDNSTTLTTGGVLVDPRPDNGERAVVVNAASLISGFVAFDVSAVQR